MTVKVKDEWTKVSRVHVVVTSILFAVKRIKQEVEHYDSSTSRMRTCDGVPLEADGHTVLVLTPCQYTFFREGMLHAAYVLSQEVKMSDSDSDSDSEEE